MPMKPSDPHEWIKDPPKSEHGIAAEIVNVPAPLTPQEVLDQYSTDTIKLTTDIKEF